MINPGCVGGTDTAAYATGRRTVLVVDDDVDVTDGLHEVLSQHYVVESADDVPAALDRISQHPPDVVLLDCHLPRSDDGVSQVVDTANRTGAAVVLMSGDSDVLRTLSVYLGYACLCKPCGSAELLVAVGDALQGRSGRLRAVG